MNTKTHEEEVAWATEMARLEDELGELPPGGASGGSVAARRRAKVQEAWAAKRAHPETAADRAEVVRWTWDEFIHRHPLSFEAMREGLAALRATTDLRDELFAAEVLVCGERGPEERWSCHALADHEVTWSDRRLHCCARHLPLARSYAANDGSGDRTDDPYVEAIGWDESTRARWAPIQAKREADERRRAEEDVS